MSADLLSYLVTPDAMRGAMNDTVVGAARDLMAVRAIAKKADEGNPGALAFVRQAQEHERQGGEQPTAVQRQSIAVQCSPVPEDARNEAESGLYQAGRQVKEFKDKVPADVSAKVQTRIDELARAAAGEDVAAIKAASDALREAVAAIGQAVYAQQPQQPGAAPGSGDGGPASPGGPGPVIDAEFKDSE
jgi:hypothetical protein